MNKFFKFLKWTVMVLVSIYVVLVIVRAFHFYNLDKTNAVVEKIHSTKLTLDDVMGKSLPPDPGIEADKTIAGIDANENGIRDDVELAIFKEYPNSAKKRAVALQYAMALQRDFTQPVINQTTVTEVVREQSRAYMCIGKIFERNDNNEQVMRKYFRDTDLLTNFVKQKHINTEAREKARDLFLEHIGSYSDLEEVCDIDYSKLPN